MKAYTAYDVNPRLLFKRLKDANQPLVGIKFYGPARTKVPMACIGFEDNADDSVILDILSEISGEKQESEMMDKIEKDLLKKFGL